MKKLADKQRSLEDKFNDIIKRNINHERKPSRRSKKIEQAGDTDMSLMSQKSLKSLRCEKKKIDSSKNISDGLANFGSNLSDFDKQSHHENPFLRTKLTSNDNFDIEFPIEKENYDNKFIYTQILILFFIISSKIEKNQESFDKNQNLFQSNKSKNLSN